MDKIRVLLVDDEPDLLLVMGKTIESWGYRLIQASNGAEAIAIVTDNKADIIILDYLMPGLDGIDTLREIRKINAKIPVIMFSAHQGGVPIKGTENLGISVSVPKSSAESTLRVAISMLETKIEKKPA
ncbi:MAG: response regulator [Candidatus Omnitrophota bacterium]